MARRNLAVSPKALEKAPCPCGTGASYRRCCAPYLAGEREAPTAEALMRARYSANARTRTGTNGKHQHNRCKL